VTKKDSISLVPYMTNYSQLYFRRMTGGYSEGFNMSEVMKSRGKRPGFFEVPSDQHQIRESDAVASLS